MIHSKTCPAKTFSKWACEVGFRKLAKSCILHNSLLSNLLRQSIWCFLINWWSWIARLTEYPDSINICPIHGFGKWISWIHFLNFSLFARPYSSWSCFHGFTAPSFLKSCPTKLIFCLEKEEKKTLLLSIRIWLWSHENWDKIADGTKCLTWEFTIPGVNNFSIVFRKTLC